MKKSILLIIIILCQFGIIKAQVKYDFVGIGYNYSVYPKHDWLNAYIDEYNTKTPGVKTKMPQLHDMEGFNIYFGEVDNGNFLWSWAWVGRNKIVSGESVDPVTGIHTKTDVQIQANTLNFSFAYDISKIVQPGLSCDLGTQANYVRKYDPGSKPVAWSKQGDDVFQGGLSVFVNFLIPVTKAHKGKLVIKPYYQLMVLPTPYGTLENGLVSKQYFSPGESQGDYLNNFGVLFSLQYSWFPKWH